MVSRSPSQIDCIIRSLAAPQLGLVTANQLIRAGLSPSTLTRRQQSGMMQRVFPGVYRLAGHPEVQHQRVLAAALAVPESCITGASAAIIHGFPASRAAVGDETPVLLVPGNVVVRTAGLQTFRTGQRYSSRPWNGVRLSTPVVTLVLLPRFVPLATVERCLDHFLAHRLVTIASVRKLIESTIPEAIVGRADLIELVESRSNKAKHRSGLEQRVARWLRDLSLDGWIANMLVETPGGPVEVDFAWVAQRVVLEVSPFFTHGSREKQDRDIERRRALVEAGWRVIEATDRDLASAAAFAQTGQLLRRLLKTCAIPSPER